jgi:hypothetical protein
MQHDSVRVRMRVLAWASVNSAGVSHQRERRGPLGPLSIPPLGVATNGSAGVNPSSSRVPGFGELGGGFCLPV